MVRLASFNRNAPAGPARNKLLGMVHIASKALDMAEEDYRHLLHRVTGRSSAKDCSVAQLHDIMREFERLGFRREGAASPRASRATHPVAKKARALWISLFHLGAIESPTERALETFAKRQLGVDRLQWADQSEGFRLIEALKAMAERHGWSQAVPARMTAHDRLWRLKDALIAAQIAKLVTAGAAPSGPVAGDRANWSLAELEAVSHELGARLRVVNADGR